MLTKDTVVLIPAYKPTDALIPLVDELLSVGFAVVVVNDGSGGEYDTIFDKVAEVCTVLNHANNMGKGVALKTGIQHIYEKMKDYKAIVTADADGQHLCSDIIRVVDALDGSEQLVLGSRTFSNERGDIPFRSLLGNKMTSVSFALIGGVKLSDTQTGLRAFPSSLSPMLLEIEGERYEYEINMLLECAKHKCPISEIPIKVIYIENNASSHFHPVRDSVRIYSRLLKFAAASLSSFLLDYILFLFFSYVLKVPIENKKTLTTVANVAARVFSSAYNFTVNKKFVFKHKSDTVGSALRYFVLAVSILVVDTLLLILLCDIIGVPKWLAKPIVETTMFILSYNVQKKLVFGKVKQNEGK